MFSCFLILSVLSLPFQVQSAGVAGEVLTGKDQSVLPGVAIELIEDSGEEVVQRTVTDDLGRFRLLNITPGNYRLRARLPGFSDNESPPFSLSAGQQKSLRVELTLAGLREQVEVVADREEESRQTGTSAETLAAERINVAPVRGDDFSDLLPLMPGVVRATDGRLNMKGGEANQSSLVVNNSTNATDPVTGEAGFNLPTDAIETVNVLPNPYAAEFGRFSAGITNILTRQGTDKWSYTVNNFFPRLKIRDGAIMGLGGFTPRLGIRGPLVEGKAYIAQTLRYKFLKTKIPAQPDLVADTRLESLESFTQLDLNLNESNTLSALFAVFPRRLDYVNLDTFNAQPVTSNLHTRGYGVSLSERATLSPEVILDSTLAYKRYDADIFGQGLGEMNWTPDLNTGNFFNIQRRNTRTLQWVESLSVYRSNWGGEHLFKFGIDLLHASFDGLSQSRPVNIVRADGSRVRRIEYGAATSQRERATDLAFFAQDRWRFSDRFLLELGARVDRDGALEQSHFSPRAGVVIGVLPDGRGILRGGAGLFYDRTPLNVTSFESYERPTVTRYAADGVTAIEMRQFTLRAAEDLQTPYSFTWNIEYDHRLTPKLLLKTNYLRRTGQHEYLIDPLPGVDSQLRLDSRGRSRYWEVEVTSRYDIDDESFFILSYVRSQSERDLNTFDAFYGNFRNPIIRPNAFSLSNTDTPHRFIAQGTFIVPGDWIVSPVIEIRQGFPYSLINEEREFIGQRNRDGRFPIQKTVDLDIQKWVKIWKWNTRVGVRFFNLLGTFNPRDFQGNVDSNDFGAFTNKLRRVIGLTFQIEN